MVRAMRDGRRICGLAHRLVWQHVHGDIPAGLTVKHKNGLKDDNRPENLELATISEQAKHSHRSGLRDQHGEKNPSVKLTDNAVAQIRLAYDQGGHDMQALAERFGVSFTRPSLRSCVASGAGSKAARWSLLTNGIMQAVAGRTENLLAGRTVRDPCR